MWRNPEYFTPNPSLQQQERSKNPSIRTHEKPIKNLQIWTHRPEKAGEKDEKLTEEKREGAACGRT